jgi:hypothetical protein
MKPFQSDLQAIQAIITALGEVDARHYSVMKIVQLQCPKCGEPDSSAIWEIYLGRGEFGKRPAVQATRCDSCGGDQGETEIYYY